MDRTHTRFKSWFEPKKRSPQNTRAAAETILRTVLLLSHQALALTWVYPHQVARSLQKSVQRDIGSGQILQRRPPRSVQVIYVIPGQQVKHDYSLRHTRYTIVFNTWQKSIRANSNFRFRNPSQSGTVDLLLGLHFWFMKTGTAEFVLCKTHSRV